MNHQAKLSDRVSGLFLWCVVFFLLAIAVASTINRSFAILSGQLLLDPPRPKLSTTVMQRLGKYDQTFVSHPLFTFLHIIPGSVFLILAICQFAPAIRRHHIRFHRWSGRVIILLAILGATSGLVLGVPFQFTGVVASSAIIFFGLVFLIALIRAFIFIRRHDIARHREWMIRAFSIGIGISTVRIVGGMLMMATRSISGELLWLSFWIGWTLTLGFAEFWIRFTRPYIIFSFN